MTAQQSMPLLVADDTAEQIANELVGPPLDRAAARAYSDVELARRAQEHELTAANMAPKRARRKKAAALGIAANRDASRVLLVNDTGADLPPAVQAAIRAAAVAGEGLPEEIADLFAVSMLPLPWDIDGRAGDLRAVVTFRPDPAPVAARVAAELADAASFLGLTCEAGRAANAAREAAALEPAAAFPIMLPDRSWGASVEGAAEIGARIRVTTRAGKTWLATVREVHFARGGRTIVTAAGDDPPEARTSSGRRGRGRGRSTHASIGGRDYFQNAKGRCEDAPCCGCCS